MKSIYGSKPVTLNRAINYLHIQLAAFQLDPADSDFRRGYEQALHDMRVDLCLGISGTWETLIDTGRRVSNLSR
jgi:hypothetical protein